jgi:hypothetical protein
MRAQADLTIKISFFSNYHTLLYFSKKRLQTLTLPFFSFMYDPTFSIHVNERVRYDHTDSLCFVTMMQFQWIHWPNSKQSNWTQAESIRTNVLHWNKRRLQHVTNHSKASFGWLPSNHGTPGNHIPLRHLIKRHPCQL